MAAAASFALRFFDISAAQGVSYKRRGVRRGGQGGHAFHLRLALRLVVHGPGHEGAIRLGNDV
jgi:hypothetical protein